MHEGFKFGGMLHEAEYVQIRKITIQIYTL